MAHEQIVLENVCISEKSVPDPYPVRTSSVLVDLREVLRNVYIFAKSIFAGTNHPYSNPYSEIRKV